MWLAVEKSKPYADFLLHQFKKQGKNDTKLFTVIFLKHTWIFQK